MNSVDVPKDTGVMLSEVEYAEESRKMRAEEGLEYHIHLLEEALRFFDMLKGFIVGTIFSSIKLEGSKQYFLNRRPNEAFRLIEYELSFLYDLFHTKVVMVRSRWGYFFRAVSFSFILGALMVFLFLEKQHEFPNKLDVKLSYTLLIGALGLEIINAWRLLFSDWTVFALKGRWRKIFATFILRRQRWSRSCCQYDMISYCLNGPPMWLSKPAALVRLGETLDKLYMWVVLHSRMVGKHLEEFVSTQLSHKSLMAKSLQAGMEVCSQRGDMALLQSNRGSKLKWIIEEYEYGESLLLWHVATEICYQLRPKQDETLPDAICKRLFDYIVYLFGLQPSHPIQDEMHLDEICKQLSDYMFYLFVLQPTLMGPVLDGWERAFKDTCEEAKRFFKGKRLEGLHQQIACEKILDVKTPVRPDTVKGNNCKSVLFDASILAKQLLNLGDNQWEIMSQVWMELMSYAAIKCRPILHAQQPSHGGNS